MTDFHNQLQSVNSPRVYFIQVSVVHAVLNLFLNHLLFQRVYLKKKKKGFLKGHVSKMTLFCCWSGSGQGKNLYVDLLLKTSFRPMKETQLLKDWQKQAATSILRKPHGSVALTTLRSWVPWETHFFDQMQTLRDEQQVLPEKKKMVAEKKCRSI